MTSTSSLKTACTRLKTLNVALIGPPGSGKGSYGKLLAKSLPRATLITASDVIRGHNLAANQANATPTQPPNSSTNNEEQLRAMASGSLLSDTFVSEVILKYMLRKQDESANRRTKTIPGSAIHIFDGFPRTMGQIQAMNETWPMHLQIQKAVSLEVPRTVCEMKLLGRRECQSCGKAVNIANVNNVDGFVLPPSLCGCIRPSYTQRDDDNPAVIQNRLDVFDRQTAPILDHYDSKDGGGTALLRFAPYRGYDDLARFQTALQHWLGVEVGGKDSTVT